MNTITNLQIGYFFVTWILVFFLAVIWTPSTTTNTLIKTLCWIIVAMGGFILFQASGFIVRVPQ